MKDESLSALLDGGCRPSELEAALEALGRDPALRARFSRMALVQEALHGTRIRKPDFDFADRVMRALDTGPAAAPAAGAAVAAVARQPRWQPVAGLALAAAVGAAAVLVIRPQAPVPGPVAVAPVVPAVTDTAQALPATLDPARAQLQNYLITYSQSRAQHGFGGSLGYARYTAYSGDTPQDSER
jgi:negative regulator of sigma E activity